MLEGRLTLVVEARTLDSRPATASASPAIGRTGSPIPTAGRAPSSCGSTRWRGATGRSVSAGGWASPVGSHRPFTLPVAPAITVSRVRDLHGPPEPIPSAAFGRPSPTDTTHERHPGPDRAGDGGGPRQSGSPPRPGSSRRDGGSPCSTSTGRAWTRRRRARPARRGAGDHRGRLRPGGGGGRDAAGADRFGRLDALVNNAGIAIFKPMMETTFADWSRVLAVNLSGPFLCTQAAVPLLAARGGAIVNITSISGLRASTLRTAYGTSKAALAQLTKQQAVELAQFGIRVNAVAPARWTPRWPRRSTAPRSAPTTTTPCPSGATAWRPSSRRRSCSCAPSAPPSSPASSSPWMAASRPPASA